MPEITVTVKSSNDQKYSVTIDTSKTVLDFKQAIAEKSDTAAERQRLIYSGRVLKDTETLETYKILEGHTVHMVKGAAPASTSQQSQQERTTTTPATTTTPTTQTAPNPFEALGGLGGLGTMGGGPNNPYEGNPGGVNLMEQLLSNPAVMQYMSQMVQDPQFIDQMIAMNPQLASMRQMMQDPEFQALMSNPEALRSMANLSSLMGPGPFVGGNALGGQTTRPNPSATTPARANPAATTQPSSTTTTATTGTTGTTPSSTAPNTSTPPLNPFLSLFNPALAGAGTGNPNSTQPSMAAFGPLLWATQSQAAPQQPPEVRYQVQLQQLNDMGFYDAQENITALDMCSGNVNAAVDMLLSRNRTM